jgi:flagellar basal body P-ring formation protein FlgA
MKSRLFFILRTAILLMVGALADDQTMASSSRQDFQTLRAQAGAWLESLAMKTYPDSQARVRIGPVDERLNLPACPEPRFFLPQGGRTWGNGSLGARCEGAVKWSLYLTFESHLRGPALVAARPMPARSVPGPGDLELRLLDYQQDPDKYLREFPPDSKLLQPIATGQPLLLGVLDQPDVIRAGQKIQVRATGSGFNVSQEGTALGRAAPGDTVKVKMPSGRIVQGIATREGQVAVSP